MPSCGPFPTIAKGLIKNAFRDVFGFNVKVQREHIIDEYSNNMRFLDFDVERA